jgi:hypothetical protein
MAHVGDELRFVLACDLEVFDRLGEFTRAGLNLLDNLVFSMAMTA